MRASSKKRILRWVILDLCAFCVMAYLICAQVFRFFPWKPVDITETMTVLATPTPLVATPTPAPTDTPTPTDTPAPTTEGTDAPGSSDPQAAASAPADTPEPTATPEPTPAPTEEPKGLLRGKYAEKFSASQVVSTEKEYRSENVAIEMTSKTGYVCKKCYHTSENYGTCPFCGSELTNKSGKNGNKLTYMVADIYVQDVSSLRTAYSDSNQKRVKDMCKENNGLLAINGDMYMTSHKNNYGWFVRNGVEIARHSKLRTDLCILYSDGTVETVDIQTQTVNIEGIYAKFPQQIWYFGPALLGADGSAKDTFTIGRNVAGNNPRSVFGYYEPGHYCFITVDGRDNDRGISMAELSMLCADMGMAAAYNMDGGGSSCMYFAGKNYGQNTRGTTDIVYITEPAKEN